MGQRIYLYFLLCLIIMLIFCPDGRLQAAAAPTSQPFFTAALELPERPKPPTPPSVSGLKKESPPPEKEKPPQKAEKPQPNSEKRTPQPRNDEKKPTAPKIERQEPSPTATPNNAYQTDLTTDATNNAPNEKDDKTRPEKSTANTLASFFSSTNKLFYGIVIACLLGLTAYFYYTTPAETRRPKQSLRKMPSKTTVTEHRKTKTIRQTEITLLTEMPKIKNPSLLEQLIKYDMETYGELRSNLDYEQPAYVEKLIRKYGGNDSAKINRAINLFYNSRRDKK